MNLRSPIRGTKRINQSYGHTTLVSPDRVAGSPLVKASQRTLQSSTPTLPAVIKLNIDQFSVIRHLGSGATGRVFEVEDRISGKHTALKVIQKSLLKGGQDWNVIREQRAFVRNAGNLHAIQLDASFHDTANFYLVMVCSHPSSSDDVCLIDFPCSRCNAEAICASELPQRSKEFLWHSLNSTQPS